VRALEVQRSVREVELLLPHKRTCVLPSVGEVQGSLQQLLGLLARSTPPVCADVRAVVRKGSSEI
jgi:hypothetical protein